MAKRASSERKGSRTTVGAPRSPSAALARALQANRFRRKGKALKAAGSSKAADEPTPLSQTRILAESATDEPVLIEGDEPMGGAGDSGLAEVEVMHL